jgi:hypothetical protein
MVIETGGDDLTMMELIEAIAEINSTIYQYINYGKPTS